MVEPVRIGVQVLQHWFDRAPQSPPRAAQPAAQTLHRRRLGQGAHRPPDRPGGQQCSRPGQRVVLFGEHLNRAGRLGAPPSPFRPHEHHRSSEAGRVDQSVDTPTVAMCQHPTPWTTAWSPHRRLHPDGQSVRPPLDTCHMKPIDPKQGITARAIIVITSNMTVGRVGKLAHRSKSLGRTA